MKDRRIIEADPALAGCLTAIAITAKASWRYPVSWLYAWREALTLTPGYIRDHPTFVYLHHHRLVGFYSLAKTSIATDLDHLWILPSAMGQGVGRELFAHAVLQSIQHGAREMMIESDPYAVGFYQKMGAQKIGHRDASMEGVARQLPLLRKNLFVCA